MANPWTLLRGLWSRDRPARLRSVGVLVLTLGIVGAGAYDWVETRNADPALDELSAPGYLRAREKQAKDMMGPMGPMLMDLQDALAQPGTRALIIAGVSALIAWGAFRAAATAAENARDDASR